MPEITRTPQQETEAVLTTLKNASKNSEHRWLNCAQIAQHADLRYRRAYDILCELLEQKRVKNWGISNWEISG